tara:strand:- start:2572 stop:2787 length:216 start_codon:yes stop_codon:yes gene_type:complete
MAELITNLKNKPLEELEEALNVLSQENVSTAFIDIDGTAYMIPKTVLKLVDSLASEVEKLKSEKEKWNIEK